MRALGFAAVLILTAPSADAGAFQLSSRCPPSFERLADGTCRLVTLYAFAATAPAGHGGLRVPIPAPRERFTPQEIDLGRYLFFDPILSARRDMSCATCHDPEKGFGDGRKRALGAVELDRKAPTLWNVGLNDRLMWDGRAASLEEQALMPLTSPNEMANTKEKAVADLFAAPGYVALFEEAFGRKPDVAGLVRALAAFETSLVSFNSRYDRYANGDSAALGPQEIRGHNLFRGFVARCSQCHVPPLFTDNELAVVGAPADDRGRFDAGAGALSGDPNLKGAFKVPTLRNVALTAPYFSAGQFATLKDVVGFYNATRGHAAPAGERLKIHWHVHMTGSPELTEGDVDDLVAFLATLTDQSMKPAVPDALPSGLARPAPRPADNR